MKLSARDREQKDLVSTLRHSQSAGRGANIGVPICTSRQTSMPAFHLVSVPHSPPGVLQILYAHIRPRS